MTIIRSVGFASILYNPTHAIRPELVTAAVDELATEGAMFTSDSRMSTARLARNIDCAARPACRAASFASATVIVRSRSDGERDAAGTRRGEAVPSSQSDRLLR